MEIKCGVFTHNISDHLSTFVKINTNTRERKLRPEIRVLNDKNIEVFKYKIQNADVNSVIEQSNCSETKWQNFLIKITNAFHESFPFKKVSIKHHKKQDWVTDCIRKSSLTKEILYKKWMKNKTKYEHKRLRYFKQCFRT